MLLILGAKRGVNDGSGMRCERHTILLRVLAAVVLRCREKGIAEITQAQNCDERLNSVAGHHRPGKALKKR